jgi:hypothetical protein
MKKTIITLSLILGMTTTTFADGGLFHRGNNARNGASGYTYFSAQGIGDLRADEPTPLLPIHGETDDQDAPLGSGIVMLASLGAAYLVGKNARKNK